jgi:opacity protein-like surface antigen
MLNYKTIAASLLLTTSSVCSYDVVLGLQAHMSHLSAKTQSMMEINVPPLPTLQNTYNFNYSSRRIHPNLLGGISWNYQNFVFGLEGEYTPNPRLKSSMHHGNGFKYHNQLQSKQAYNLGAKVGYHITPNIHVYAKALVEKRSFTHSVGREDVGISDQHTKDFRKMGYGGALGLEFSLDRKWSIHTEMREITHGNINITHKLFNNETHKFKMHPDVTTFLVGFKYRLGIIA